MLRNLKDGDKVRIDTGEEKEKSKDGAAEDEDEAD
jgi:hypothetical protein